HQVKNDWQYTLNARWRFKTGIQYTWHQFKPGAGEVKSGEQDFKPDINEQHAREAAAYISAETDVTDRLQIAAGLRYSYFNQVGKTTREKFLEYVNNHPHMLQRVPQKILASYLNIKPETFSRLKHLIRAQK
ncbi:MAG: TonB-dependent receptor, partial [Sphingobacteriales bacterium]